MSNIIPPSTPPNQIFSRTIRNQLMSSFMLIGLLPLMVVVVAFSITAVYGQSQATQQEIEAAGWQTEEDLNRYLSERQRLVEMMAAAPSLRQAMAEDAPLLQSQQAGQVLDQFANAALLTHVWLFDMEGNVLAVTDGVSGGGTAAPVSFTLPPDLFQQARTHIQQTKQPTTIPLVHIPATQDWYTFWVYPVLHQDQLVGMILLQEKSDYLVQHILQRAATRLGETGQVLLFAPNQQGALTLVNLSEGMRDKWQGYVPEGFTGNDYTQEVNYRGEMAYLYYHAVTGTEWQLIVEQEMQAVYATIQTQQGIIALIAIALATAIYLLGSHVSDMFSAPIRTLQESVRQVAQGNLETRAQPFGRAPREIKQLTADMNNMASQLQSMFNQLEGRIEVGSSHLETTAEIARRIVELRNPQEIMTLVVNTIQARLNLYAATLLLIHHEPNQPPQAVVEAISCPSAEVQKLIGYAIPLHQKSIIGWVAQQRQPYNAPRVADDPYFLPHPTLPQVVSEVALPLLRDGVVLGVLDLHSSTPEAFHPDYVRNLQGLADQITIALENGRLFQQTQQQAEEMKQAFRRAEEASLSKSTFLANMSHELRTPMNAIMGFAQVLERDATLTAKQREYLRIISRSSDHLLTLINDVLEMSKIEAGGTVLSMQPFDLHHTLTDIKEMFWVRTEAKHLTMQFGMAADVPRYVVTDERKLRQVLINLLGNALKFTDTGGISVRVGYEAADQPPDRLHFAVEDTGEGIRAEEIDLLFQPFVQTASGLRRQEGTGLGLTITRQFINLLGGEISVQSNVGEGTVVQFEIPITLADAASVRGETVYRRVLRIKPSPTGQTEPVRILVVDDRPENRQLLREWLTAVGFEVREAENGREAIAQWQAWHPQLIWMDLRMPILNGYEATKQIRAQTAAPQPVIIALTASALEQDRVFFLEAGCNDFVRKPVREELIFEKMAEFLGVRYEYETAAERSDTRAPALLAVGELESAIINLPRALHHALWQASVAIDSTAAQQAIQDIGYYDAHLAHALTDLVDNYRFDQLQLLLDNTLEERDGR